jgi:ATP-dependent exoDNAse (exonuclease V) beta subunit
MTAELNDRDARAAILDDLDTTLIVEAAAGTGKTTALVGRIGRLLATGRTTIDKVVAVTFTEKAAGELKLRLRESLERERAAAQDDAVKDRLDDALTTLEEAHVGTIHGFCADLLRERPVEAGVDPLFSVLTQTQSESFFGEAFRSWLQDRLADPPEGLRRALRRPAGPAGFRATTAQQDGPADRLQSAAWELAQWRDFTGPWTSEPFARTAAVDALLVELHEFAELTASPSYARDYLYLDTAPVRHVSQEIRLQQAIGTVDYDGWEARLTALSRNRPFVNARHGRGPDYRKGLLRSRVIDAMAALRAHLDQFRMDADAELAALLQQELAGAIDRYEQAKRRAGSLDFLDLLLKARDLITGSGVARRSFQQRFTHILVDEFQDTDPLQAEILLLLTSTDPEATDWRKTSPGPGRLFVVGDPKQSIYRFRRADVAVYNEVCRRLESAGARHVKLTTSFRSVPELQSCINAAFAPVMTGDALTLQADYVPLAPFRPALPRQPSVVALPVPRPYGQRQVSMMAIERSLPDAIGAFVEWLVTKSGWSVTERRGGEPEPLRPRHVCILFRRFLSFGDDMTAPYVHALEARGIPQVLVGGKTFHNREEVESLRAALAAIEWPDDQLSVFSTLRGPLFAIGDEELLEWRHTLRRPFHPFRVPGDLAEASHLTPIADALRLLQRLHRRRNYIPVADTIHRLLAETRAHVGLVLRSGGEQALANVLHVAELARQYELAGGISFRGFVDQLRVAAGEAEAAEAPILEEGSDGVRLMTVHKAKGLEFPVVILADLTCKLARVEAGRWIDPERGICAIKLAGLSPTDLLRHGPEELAREQAEAVRLTYVAATRARDLLVVPALGDGPYEGGWLDPLNPAIYPPEPSRRTPAAAPGCQKFPSMDSVLERPDGDPAGAATVAPGAYQFASALGARLSAVESQTSSAGRRSPNAGKYQVVWWDPHALSLDAASAYGLRRDDLIVKDGDMFAVAERLAAYERWRDEKAASLQRASQRSLDVETASDWARTAAREQSLTLLHPAPAVADIATIETPIAPGRPSGRRFGTLVHAVLAAVSLDAAEDSVRSTAAMQARILAAGDDELEAAVRTTMAVLGHPLLQRARTASASGRCFREMPVTWRAPDGTLVEGTIDLAFDDDEGATVVDFKTDRELDADAERYRRQLTVYCRAYAELRGTAPRGILLRV